MVLKEQRLSVTTPSFKQSGRAGKINPCQGEVTSGPGGLQISCHLLLIHYNSVLYFADKIVIYVIP